jgi:hypothetical protein
MLKAALLFLTLAGTPAADAIERDTPAGATVAPGARAAVLVHAPAEERLEDARADSDARTEERLSADRPSGLPERMGVFGTDGFDAVPGPDGATVVMAAPAGPLVDAVRAPIGDLPDLRGYDPVRNAFCLEVPLRVLHGERDSQVKHLDFDTWHRSPRGRGRAVSPLGLYVELNHLLVAGTGPSAPVNYARPGYVAPAVIDDVVAWTAKLHPR